MKMPSRKEQERRRNFLERSLEQAREEKAKIEALTPSNPISTKIKELMIRTNDLHIEILTEEAEHDEH